MEAQVESDYYFKRILTGCLLIVMIINTVIIAVYVSIYPTCGHSNIWLIMHASLTDVYVLLFCLICKLLSNGGPYLELVRAIASGVTSFSYGWLLVGNVWLYNNQKCYTENTNYYIMFITILIFDTIYVALMLLCIILLCTTCFVQMSRNHNTVSHQRNIQAGLERLPTIKYDPAPPSNSSGIIMNGDSSNANTCVICLEDYKKDDIVTILPLCKHKFHKQCIGLWLYQSTTCPICRGNIPVTINDDVV